MMEYKHSIENIVAADYLLLHYTGIYAVQDYLNEESI